MSLIASIFTTLLRCQETDISHSQAHVQYKDFVKGTYTDSPQAQVEDTDSSQAHVEDTDISQANVQDTDSSKSPVQDTVHMTMSKTQFPSSCPRHSS